MQIKRGEKRILFFCSPRRADRVFSVYLRHDISQLCHARLLHYILQSFAGYENQFLAADSISRHGFDIFLASALQSRPDTAEVTRPVVPTSA